MMEIGACQSWVLYVCVSVDVMFWQWRHVRTLAKSDVSG